MLRSLMMVALVAALAAPAALAADPLPADFKNAAKYCKALRTAKGPAFQTQFVTNGNGKNAFGKCVSATAKTKAAKREDAEDDDADSTAATACKALQKADAAKFARDYKNMGQCVKAGKAKNA